MRFLRQIFRKTRRNRPHDKKSQSSECVIRNVAGVLVEPIQEHCQEKKVKFPSDCAVPWSKYLQYFDDLCDNGRTKFSKQFMELLYTAEENKEAEGLTWQIALQLENMTRNQYLDALPYDQRRVVLGCRGPTTQEQTPNDYINASFIYHIPPCTKDHVGLDFEKIDYIATQGPLESTCGDFWRMVMDQGSTLIVMLTNLQVGPKKVCAQYWPDKPREKREFISDSVRITVELTKTEQHEGLVQRKFRVQFSDEPRKQVTVRQLHMTSWPDMNIPEAAHFESLLNRYADLRDRDVIAGPPIVHCRAGVGRTGTFIAADVLRRHLRTEENAAIDIPGIILQLRRCRPSMIENLSQYIHVHEYAKKLVENRMHHPLDNAGRKCRNYR